MENKGWYGCDLDSTLAHYDEFVDATHIGAPIPLMVHRVKTMLGEGKDVRIFTARAYLPGFHAPDLHPVKKAIQDWCLEHVGKILPITNKKDFQMIGLFDDRAIQIELNTGMRMDGVKDYNCPCCDEPVTDIIYDLETGLIKDDCTCPEWCPNA